MTFEEWFHKEYEPADLQINRCAERKEGLHIPATVYLEDLKKAFEAGQKDLEKENAELKEKLNNLASVAKVRLANWQKYEKENAELKELDRSYKQLLDKGSTTLMNERLKSYKQLTKAKNLLNEFMRISKASDEDFEHDYSELIAEAEQFLKE